MAMKKDTSTTFRNATSLSRAHPKRTDTKPKSVLWSDESIFSYFWEIMDNLSSGPKEETDCPDIYQYKGQKPTSVMM